MYQTGKSLVATLCLLLVGLNLDLCSAAPHHSHIRFGVHVGEVGSLVPAPVHIHRSPVYVNSVPSFHPIHTTWVHSSAAVAARPQPVHSVVPDWINNHNQPQPVEFIVHPTAAPATTPSVPSVVVTSTAAPIAVPQPSLQEQCAQLNNNYTSEKQSMHYVDGFEALAKTLVDLDETVQQMKPVQKMCEPQQPSFNINIRAGETEASEPISSSPSSRTDWGFSNWSVSDYSTASPVSSTTESFTDAPIVSEVPSLNGRYRREDKPDGNNFFGFPSLGSSTNSPADSDQAGEDLAKAASDLKTLRKDLNSTAEWLRQSNHYVHSAMLRALQAYVASIERRIEHQRQVYAQTKTFGLKSKVTAIKEKVASLIEKLRAHIG